MNLPAEVNFCLRCGQALAMEPSFGRLRPVCPACGWIYFSDPKVAVAVLVEQNGNVLLVRRVNQPYQGRWSLPAGFIDAGEEPQRAAERECLEETGLQIRITRLVDVLSGQEHPRGAHILIVYQGEVIAGEITPGDDADKAGFFPRHALPPLAFASSYRILDM